MCLFLKFDFVDAIAVLTSFITVNGFRCFKISVYIFDQEVFAIHFLFRGIFLLLHRLMLPFIHLLKKNYIRFPLSIPGMFPGIKYFNQLQSFVFTTRALSYVNTKLLQHAYLQRYFYKTFMQRQFHFL